MGETNNKTEPILRPNMPELDSVRGIAILMVLLFHGFFMATDLSKFYGPGKIFISFTHVGWLGVQLFFVLSGFLITGILLDTKEKPGYYKRFYFRRALRILPIYLAVLFVLLILGVIQWQFLLLSVFFISNFTSLFGVALQYGPLWTLAVEEQFYLLWPQAVRRLSKKSLAVLAFSIVTLTPFLRWIGFMFNQSAGLYFFTWFLADGLALGALLAIYFRSEQATRQEASRISLLLVAISASMFLIGVPFGILHRTTVIGAMFQLVPWHLFFAGTIITTLLIGTSKWKKFVNLKWLQYLGKISYGLYLIHLLIFNELDLLMQKFFPNINEVLHTTIFGLFYRFIIAVCVSVLVAGISRKYFEEFFLKFKNSIKII